MFSSSLRRKEAKSFINLTINQTGYAGMATLSYALGEHLVTYLHVHSKLPGIVQLPSVVIVAYTAVGETPLIRDSQAGQESGSGLALPKSIHYLVSSWGACSNLGIIRFMPALAKIS